MPKSSKSQEARNLNLGPKVSRMTPLYKEIEQETKPFQNADFCEISCVRQGGQFRAGVKSYKCHVIGSKAWWSVFVGNQNSQNLNFLGPLPRPYAALPLPNFQRKPDSFKHCVSHHGHDCAVMLPACKCHHMLSKFPEKHTWIYTILHHQRDLKHFGRWSAKCCYKMRQPGEQMCNDSPNVPYKMQNPEVRSSRNQNFGNTWKQHGSTTKCQTRFIVFMKKWFWYNMYGPGGLWRIKSWSKPALYQNRVNVFCRGNSSPDVPKTKTILKSFWGQDQSDKGRSEFMFGAAPQCSQTELGMRVHGWLFRMPLRGWKNWQMKGKLSRGCHSWIMAISRLR